MRADDGELIVGIIQSPRCGRRDLSYPVLSFDVVGDGWGVLQVFDLRDNEGLGMGLLSGVTDVRDLTGRACVMERTDGNMIRFVKLLPRAKP